MGEREIQNLIDDVINSYETQIAILREDLEQQISNLEKRIEDLESKE